MAEISVDLRNISGAKKCASSSPRLVSLELEAVSPGCANESAVNGYFLDHQVSRNDMKNIEGLIHGCDGKALIRSQLSLSNLPCDESLTDNILATNDNDVDLSDILNSIKLAETVNVGMENSHSKKNTADDKTKVISSADVSGSLSNLLSSVAQEASIKDDNTTIDHRKLQKTQVCGFELLNFDFDANKGMNDSPSSNNSSLKVEGNLSDLLSLINIGESDATNAGNFNSSDKSNSKNASKFVTENQPEVPNLSDLLSSVDLGKSNIESGYQAKMKVVETKNDSCLADLLHSVDTDKPLLNKKTSNLGSTNLFLQSTNFDKLDSEYQPEVHNLSDILSSIDLEKSNNESCYQTDMKVVETKNDSCLADLLHSVDIDKPLLNKKKLNFGSTNLFLQSSNVNKLDSENQPEEPNVSDLLSSTDLGKSNNEGFYQTDMNVVKTKNDSCLADLLHSVDIAKPVLNNKPLNFGSTNLFSKSSNTVSDSFKDIAFDVSDSSNTSYASSLSETDDSSPTNSSMKNNLKNKVLESDSSYGSLDSANKGFSFFDYSSDNQFSFNTLLSDNSGFNKESTHNCEDAGNVDEEMSMSDLLTIVSPDFKIPVLATLNKKGKPNSSVNDSNMLDLIESLNKNSKNSNWDDKSNGKLLNVDCVDGQTSTKTRSDKGTFNSNVNDSLEKYILIDGSDIGGNGDKSTIADEQISFIDLRECIKSVKQEFTPESPITQIKSFEKPSPKCVSPYKVQLHCEEKPLNLSYNSPNQFEFHDRTPMKKIRVNSKQTMFSKALACKPKKDQSLLQKVASIKSELLNNIIFPPVLIDCNVPQPVVEIVLQSDRCVVPNMDRKSFGPYEAYELQL